jgi:Lon protease-like protein
VVSSRLPLFPLGAVLFPGLVLPLHVFEERYRSLVRDLDARGEGEREFGVVAIRQGWETEDGQTQAQPPVLHEIGCTAELQQVTTLPDGRFDIVSVGRRRFSIVSVDDTSAPYLTAEVEWLTEPESPPGELDRLVPGVLDRFQRYLRTLRPDTAGEQLPDDPTVLSHLIAATMVLDLPERQSLLAATGTAARLRSERRLLSRELVLLEEIGAVPVTPAEFSVTASPN